jgi:hypothetical protein
VKIVPVHVIFDKGGLFKPNEPACSLPYPGRMLIHYWRIAASGKVPSTCARSMSFFRGEPTPSID